MKLQGSHFVGDCDRNVYHIFLGVVVVRWSENIAVMFQGIMIAGMWKGLTPRIIMIGTLTALQWFIYDGVKVAFKLVLFLHFFLSRSLKNGYYYYQIASSSATGGPRVAQTKMGCTRKDRSFVNGREKEYDTEVWMETVYLLRGCYIDLCWNTWSKN